MRTLGREYLRLLQTAEEGMPPGYRRPHSRNRVVLPEDLGIWAFAVGPCKRNGIVNYGYTL